MDTSLESRARTWALAAIEDPPRAAAVAGAAREAGFWRPFAEMAARRHGDIPELHGALGRAGIARDRRMEPIDDAHLEEMAVGMARSRRPISPERPAANGWARLQVGRGHVLAAAEAITRSRVGEGGHVAVEGCHDGIATFLANAPALAVAAYERSGRTFKPTGASFRGRDAVAYLEATFGAMPFRSVDVMARLPAGSALRAGFDAAAAKSEDILVGETLAGLRRAAARIREAGGAGAGLVARSLVPKAPGSKHLGTGIGG